MKSHDLIQAVVATQAALNVNGKQSDEQVARRRILERTVSMLRLWYFQGVIDVAPREVLRIAAQLERYPEYMGDSIVEEAANLNKAMGNHSLWFSIN